jgi:lysine 6-dehydrogenase
MKMLVLGAGLQGSACAFDLLQHAAVERVTLADLPGIPLAPFLVPFVGDRLQLQTLDVTDLAAVRRVMTGHDAVMSAIPYYHNGPLSAAAIDCGCHWADLGGNTEIVIEQKQLDPCARSRGVAVVPDCGLAPGMVNVLAAEGIRRMDVADRVKIYVGGLPQSPEPPLNYQIVYSLEGVLDYYTTPSWILRDGAPRQVEPLSELEWVDFPDPIGRLEAFHTGGGISTLPFAYQGRVNVMEYKTLRYPGHADAMRPIRELGLLDESPVEVKGQPVSPRALFMAVVQPKLTKPDGPDLVALRVEVTGQRQGAPARVAWQLIDRYDAARGISAMMRTTGYSLAITGLMQADGRIAARGVHTPDEVVPFQAYVGELAARGICIEEAT